MADLAAIIDELREGIKALATLEIKTTVSVAGTPHEIVTKIDMLQGDISTVIDDVFFDDRYEALREFHAGREEQGHQIVKDNVEALQKLLALARDESKEQ